MTERVLISPRARRIALERNISLDSLKNSGTGYQGSICAEDILRLEAVMTPRITPVAAKLAAKNSIDINKLDGSGIRGKITKADILAAAGSKPAEAYDAFQGLSEKEIEKVIPYTGIRKIIGDRLSDSMSLAPHAFLSVDVYMDSLLDLRKQINDAQDQKTSITDYVVLAVSKALRKYPDVNVSLEGENIIRYKSCNIGVAVASDSGLIVPVVKHTEKKDLFAVSKESERLIKKARENKLLREDYSDGTFTISNLGMFGVKQFTAIINPPESAILAIGSAERMPVVVMNGGSEELSFKTVMKMTISIDHRVIDGALGAQFIAEVKKQIENPIGLII